MKVLFLTYPRIGLGHGGLQIQIEKTRQELMALGVEVILYDPWKNQIPDVDICHVFSTDGTLIYHVDKAVGAGKPVVISPVFNLFTVPFWITSIKVRLSSNIPGFYSELKRAGQMIKLAEKVLALNDDECRLLKMVFQIPEDKCKVVPNGINTSFVNGDPEKFKKQFGLQKYVLQVASIEHRKNQLNLIKAIARLPYHLVLIGQASPANKKYLHECQKLAGDNVHFVGNLDNNDPLLASAFAGAKVFVLPSYSEVMPLTIYEAAVAGCSVVVSKNVPIDEKIRGYISQVDPDNPDDIASAIKKTMERKHDYDLQEIVKTMPSWRDVAISIRDIYLDVLNSNKYLSSTGNIARS